MGRIALFFVLLASSAQMLHTQSTWCVTCEGPVGNCPFWEPHGGLYNVYCLGIFESTLDCCHDDCSWISAFRCFGSWAGCSIEHQCANYGASRAVLCYNCF